MATVNPNDPRLEAMRQQLLGASRTLSAMGAQQPVYSSSGGAIIPQSQAPTATRTLNMVSQSNTPPQAPITQSSIPQTPAYDNSGVQNFNQQIMGLLQKYQQLGTKPFVTQGLDAQQAQAGRIAAPTPQNLVGASPGTQNSVRSNYAQALDPTIQGANSSAQTFSEQLKSFGDSVTTARQLISDYQSQQDKTRDDARAVINEILTTTDPASLKSLNADELSSLEKAAGYPKDFLTNAVTYKQKQADSQKQFSTVDLGDRVAIMDGQGNIIKTYSKGVTPGTSAKPPTANQEITALYANRLEQSSSIINGLEDYARTANPLTFFGQQNAPDVLNMFKSGDFQSLDQAERNFVNAVLRRESGAAISPSEFDSARKQYFPQPGDTPQVVAQKKANRDLVVQGFISGAGGAYTPIQTPQSTSVTAYGYTFPNQAAADSFKTALISQGPSLSK